MYEKLKEKVLPQLIPDHSRILVAVSGGPDSVALAHILWRYAQDYPEKRISLVISHIHHGVREESDQEAELVQKLAQKWGVKCLVHRFQAKDYVKETGQSFQEGARQWRYSQWKKDQIQERCNLLCTAHHMGDQGETILYRLIRGSGTAGLAGIYPAKDGIIRPLLGVTKKEILDYCEKEGLPYAIDKTNLSPVYIRNKIRLELIPELEKSYNPQILKALARTGELLRQDEEYISGQVEKAWPEYVICEKAGQIGLKREVFDQPFAILSRLIRKAAAHVSNEPKGIGYNYIETILDHKNEGNWTQHLPGLVVRIERSGIWFEKPDIKRVKLEFEYRLEKGQWVNVDELGLMIGLFNNDGDYEKEDNLEEMYKAVWNEDQLNYLTDPIVFRSRREGDRLWISGVGHKQLKKIFQENKIPAVERDRIPLIASGSEVLWIPGIKENDFYKYKDYGTILKCIICKRKR